MMPAPSMSASTWVAPGATTAKSRFPPVVSQLDDRRVRPVFTYESPPSGLLGCQNFTGSSLHGAEGEAGDDATLEDYGQEHDGHRVQDGQRRHRSPVESELALEVGNHDRGRLRPERRQQQCEEELVPRGEEREDGGHGQT